MPTKTSHQHSLKPQQGFVSCSLPQYHDSPYRYKVIFEPQKTVSSKVGMVIEKSTGGRWRFELKFEATQPDVDGSITIQAGPGQSAMGPVQLFSPTDQPEHFTCHFTHDSSISFDVAPSQVMPPPCPNTILHRGNFRKWQIWVLTILLLQSMPAFARRQLAVAHLLAS